MLLLMMFSRHLRHAALLLRHECFDAAFQLSLIRCRLFRRPLTLLRHAKSDMS